MAASETVNIHQTEPVVNRWLVDYYLFLAIDYLEKEQYGDFFALRDVLDCVLDRPLESSETTPTKIRVLRFLSLINEEKRHDVAPDADPKLSPLESALDILQSMEKDCPKLDYDKACSSLKEMIVKTFIANEEIGKAKKALNKYFTKSLVGKKSIYMSLINQKRSVPETKGQMELSQFKKEMLTFCQKLCQYTNPFLFKAAVRLFGSRHTTPDDNAEEPNLQRKPEQHGCKRVFLQHCNRVFMEKSRLEAGFNVLSNEKSFLHLEEEEEQAQIKSVTLHLSPSPDDADEEINDQLNQKTADSPMEASPADEPAQTCDVSQPQTSSLSKIEIPPTMRQYTIAQLVVEPDSPTVSPEVDHDLTTDLQEQSAQEKSPEIPESMSNTLSPILGCEVSRPVRKRSFKSCDRAKVTAEDKTASVRNEDISDSEESAVNNSKRNTENGDVEVIDGLDSSPSPSLRAPRQTSSTPDKENTPKRTKWKQIFNAAKESKEVWSDEEKLFDDGSLNESIYSTAGHRKRIWTDSESQRLKEGVERFGEGNWSKIRAYYKFKDRTNVNLKDRWRTMKKLKLV